MADVGILRFDITDPITGRGAWRFEDARKLWPIATQLYREIFDGLGMSLLPGAESIRCTKDQFIAKYDYELGIDLLLTFSTGMTKTMQEKFLFTKYGTVTIEYYQDWRNQIPGDWFNLKAQNYFVGYDHPKTGQRLTHWILLNWPAVTDATSRNLIPWRTLSNTKDGAMASFRYAYFDEFPPDCVLAMHYHPGALIGRWVGTCAVCGCQVRGHNVRVPTKRVLCIPCYTSKGL